MAETEGKSIKYELDFNKLIYENQMYSVYEMRALHFGRNTNGYDVLLSAIEEALPYFYNLPMYGILNWDKTDFEDHYSGKKDTKHNLDDIRVFGIIPESSKVELIEEGEKTFIVFEAIVFKTLLPHITQILEDKDFSVKLSIEFLITKAHKDEENYIVVEGLIPQAITALGSGIPEGIKGSSMKLVRFDEQKALDRGNELYLSFNAQPKYYLPEIVINNMKEGLALKDELNRGGNQKAAEIAQNAIKYGFIFEGEMQLIKAYFATNPHQEPGVIVTNKQILHKMYGGEEILNVTSSNNAESIKIFEEGGQNMDGKHIENSEENVQNREIYIDSVKTVVEEVHIQDPELHKSVDEVVTVVRHEGEIIDTDKTEIKTKEVENQELQINEGNPKDTVEKTDPVENQDSGGNSAQAGCSENCIAKMAELNLLLNARDETILNLQTVNNELEAKCSEYVANIAEKDTAYNSVVEQLSGYQRKEEVATSQALIAQFAHCFNEKQRCDLDVLSTTNSYNDVKAEVQKGVMAFAMSKKIENTANPVVTNGPIINDYFDPKAITKEAKEKKSYHETSSCKTK